MGLLNFVRSAITFHRRIEGIHVDFREMILVIEPCTSATLYTDPGSQMIVTGFAGTILISVAGDPIQYTVKHGETLTVPGHGKTVLRPINQNVPGKVHVRYSPGEAVIH